MKRRTKGREVVRWVETHCVHTAAEWHGKPFRCMAWQKRLIYELFEVEGSGLRKYRWAYISVSKKQGKTELMAALALYLLLGDGEPAPLVVCAAASEDQADLVYGAARRMCELSPTLSQVTEPYDKEILVPADPGAVLKRVAAAAGTNDGQNIHAVICDELHEWGGTKGPQVWTVLTGGTGARRQPMVLQITTAGWDLDTICGKQYLHAKEVLKDPSVDPTFYAHVVEAPNGSDHTDPEVWKAANPSYGVTVRPEFYEDQLRKKPEADFRRYFLNQWTKSRESWLPAGAWDSCRGEVLLEPHDDVYAGVDIALYQDCTAVVTVAPKNGRYHVLSKVWYPPEGGAIDIQEVKDYIRSLQQRFTLKGVAYDPSYFHDSGQELYDEGVPMIEFWNRAARMVPASQRAYEHIAARRVVHDGDPILADHVESAARRNREEGWMLSKSKSKRKIDACIALLMALEVAGTEPDKTSVYESRGLVTI